MGEAEMSMFSWSFPAWMRRRGGQAPDPSQEIIAASAPSCRRNVALGRRSVPPPLEGVALRSANPLPLGKPVRFRKDKASVARK